MKDFMKKVPEQVASTFTIMMISFTVISKSRGIDSIPVTRLEELLFVAILGGVLMEFAFGKCVIKQMADLKRVYIFIVPFAFITFVCAVIFEWITQLDRIGTYIQFIGIFLVCGLVSVILFEIEHWLRGKEYTKKLKEYQNGGK